jgi:hypothetical protein
MLVLVVVLLTMAGWSAAAGPDELPQPDLRRTVDGYKTEGYYDDFFGHNHFQVHLLGPEDYVTYDITDVRAVVYVFEQDGSVTVRRFSTIESDGVEAFYEAPCAPCGPYGYLWFGLPPDFGGRSAIVDLWLALPGMDTPCEQAAPDQPCDGGVWGYFNTGGILLVTNPMWLDAADAFPEMMVLH